jgi:hypothetical protein
MSGTKKDATPVGLVAASEEDWQNYLSQPGLRGMSELKLLEISHCLTLLRPLL